MSNGFKHEQQSLGALFAGAEVERKELEASYDSNCDVYQRKLQSVITTYQECLETANRVSLFSPNESLDDVASSDIQYMTIHYHLAELIQRIVGVDRRSTLLSARHSYESFLRLMDSYDVLSKSDAKLYEKYRESPDSFSTASTTDAALRRETKIARLKAMQELNEKVESFTRNPDSCSSDENVIRQLHFSAIALYVHRAFESLESMAQELQILALAPRTPLPNSASIAREDLRQLNRENDSYSERLDPPLAKFPRQAGPILSADGKPLRPFTLLDSRRTLQKGVFRPDHTLPTMTIDEYLAEERKRGGIIDGGGEKSGIRPEPDEDDVEKADADTMKARAWDDFKDENPKGMGNTMNRG